MPVDSTYVGKSPTMSTVGRNPPAQGGDKAHPDDSQPVRFPVDPIFNAPSYDTPDKTMMKSSKEAGRFNSGPIWDKSGGVGFSGTPAHNKANERPTDVGAAYDGIAGQSMGTDRTTGLGAKKLPGQAVLSQVSTPKPIPQRRG